MSTERFPDTRTRVNFVQNAKGEWRLSEITIELTNHSHPVFETGLLFQKLVEMGERECTVLNAANRDKNRFS